ncbi:TRAFAC clade GTPase domain-containing protein [Leucobacter tardus]|uniref:ATP/GTP-binding protein n=1 Tax=Leucobacter tardus TaxID=501483 RepID=A0A939TUZ8_9MICO|nr:ATP/GTP-binding protein [Leucobacter tardus]MBO2990270.1 ATP/GTP-binding protein [Leucobacter tardus]
MARSRTLEQHIAVFGESGSGKTVLLSSFFGATQEPQYVRDSLYHVVADQQSQGTALMRNYLGMRDGAEVPMATRFTATSYPFTLRLKDAGSRRSHDRPFDALRLVWHDYPGEWFEQDASGPEEASRRVDTFRSLLGSDVALVLVDGQRLIDNAGQEERYLRSLLTNFRNGLLSMKNELLVKGKPLVRFPRIWMFALSKADLLPQTDVYAFRDLVLAKAGDDVIELRNVIAGLIEGQDALSVGEDFMLLSSAKFDPDRIEVHRRIGVELILPIASTLPLERHVRWAQMQQSSGRVAENLVRSAGGLGDVVGAITGVLSKVPLPGRLGMAKRLAVTVLSGKAIKRVADLSGDKLARINAQALAKRDYLTAVLTSFRMSLDHGEAARVLLRSRR